MFGFCFACFQYFIWFATSAGKVRVEEMANMFTLRTSSVADGGGKLTDGEMPGGLVKSETLLLP